AHDLRPALVGYRPLQSRPLQPHQQLHGGSLRMAHRITTNVRRPPPVSIVVNGTAIEACEGETLATALIAAGILVMSRDTAGSGRRRSPFCNMGVCFDCMVTVEEPAS